MNLGEGYINNETNMINPWTDESSSQTRGVRNDQSRKVNHRLSFDDASGVIVLPEDAHWLMDDIDSDSEEDYGNDRASNTGLGHNNSPLADATSPGMSSEIISASPRQRHGTYFHHPERRRQNMPGAFPRS